MSISIRQESGEIMSDPYTDYANTINQQFSQPFDAIYKACDKHRRKKLLPCLTNIYRRWYYSSLIENTYLTPANLFEALHRQYNHPSDLYPLVSIRTPSNYTGLTFSFRQYSQSRHPIVTDFRTIIDFCRPDIDLTESDQMPETLAIKAAKNLHMNDPYYAMYLLSLALEMGLLVKIPSIHANRHQLIHETEKHLSQSDDHLFDKLVHAALGYAARSLSELIPTPAPIFDQDYLISILKEPVEMDIILQRLYDTIGVNIEDLIGLDLHEELDVLDMAVISGAYLFGVILDKVLFTPFGHYLKLIRPIYMPPFDFENEISIYLDSNIEDDELGIAFYSPCYRYYLTEIGLKYFNVQPSPTNYLDIKNRLPFSEIAPLFEGNPTKLSDIQGIKSLSTAFDRDHFIYTLKVKYLADPRLWLTIEVSDINSLHRLYLELAYYFDLDKNAEYTFYPDETENPFISYASPNQLRRPKKTSDTILGTLALEEKQVMILTVSYPRIGGAKHKDKWALEVVKVHQGKTGQAYPAVTRLGKGLRDFFEWQ